MRTLAERLGVTKTTISLALRDHHSISKATRDRVHKLAQELNYRPDPAIAAIAARRWSCGSLDRHLVIAFLCHHASGQRNVQSRYLHGARERAKDFGYKLEPFFIDDYPSAEAASRVLYTRGTRGIIIPPISNPDSKRAMQLDWDKFTAVCCGVGRIRPPLHTVTNDVFGTTRMVWEVAAQAGFKRIGGAINCHDPIADDDWQRIGASAAAIALLGLHESAKIPLLTSEAVDEKALIRWYRKYKPELVIGFNHTTGEMLERNGVRIPEEVEFICLIAQPGSKWSGINHHYDQTSRTSVEVLNVEMRDNHWGLPELPNIILVESEWNCGTTFSHDELAAQYTSRFSRVSARKEGVLTVSG